MAQVKQRIEWIDVAKGISILLVALYHSHNYFDALGGSSEVYQAITDFFKPIRMPLFFFVSGTLAISAIRKDWTTVLEKKVWYFFYLFVIWGLVHIAFFKYLRWHHAGKFDDDLWYCWLTSLFRPETGIWFIWALMIYFPLAKLMKPYPRAATVIVLICGLIGHSGQLQRLGFNFAQKDLFMYMPFFVIPAVLGKHLLAEADRMPGKIALVAAALAGVSLLLISTLHIHVANLDKGTLRMTLSFGGLLAGVALAIYICRLPRLKNFFAYFGRHTLPIYLIHILPLSFISYLTTSMGLPYINAYGVPVTMVIIVAFSLGCEIFANRFGLSFLFNAPKISGFDGLRRRLEAN